MKNSRKSRPSALTVAAILLSSVLAVGYAVMVVYVINTPSSLSAGFVLTPMGILLAASVLLLPLCLTAFAAVVLSRAPRITRASSGQKNEGTKTFWFRVDVPDDGKR